MKIFTLFYCILVASSAIAQNVGIGTNTPNASAQLDVSSSSKGVLLPRMSTSQRSNIANPVKGLLVYDTDLNGLYHYNGVAWNAVAGSGGLSLPYAATPGLAGVAFKIDNSGPAIQASSTNTSTAAITGSSTAIGGYGITGQNHEASGFGVAGFSSAGTAVYGFSAAAGTALRGVSSSGYALRTSGNLQLSGGNTNPSAGAVFTSVDANGNAVWKPHRVGFRAVGVENTAITDDVYRKLEFSNAQCNYGSVFQPYLGSTTSESSVFTAPVAGLYHFEAGTGFSLHNNTFDLATILFQINNTTVTSNFLSIINGSGLFYASYATGNASMTIRLNANDKVSVVVYQVNSGDVAVSAKGRQAENYFSGFLVFAE